MSERTTASGALTIGLDLSDKTTEACVLDAAGGVLERFRVRTNPPALERALARFEPARVVLEVGTHSPWVSRLVTRLGHEGIVANPRRVRLMGVGVEVIQMVGGSHDTPLLAFEAVHTAKGKLIPQPRPIPLVPRVACGAVPAPVRRARIDEGDHRRAGGGALAWRSNC